MKLNSFGTISTHFLSVINISTQEGLWCCWKGKGGGGASERLQPCSHDELRPGEEVLPGGDHLPGLPWGHRSGLQDWTMFMKQYWNLSNIAGLSQKRFAMRSQTGCVKLSRPKCAVDLRYKLFLSVWVQIYFQSHNCRKLNMYLVLKGLSQNTTTKRRIANRTTTDNIVCHFFFSLCSSLSIRPGRQVVPDGSRTRCYIPQPFASQTCTPSVKRRDYPPFKI